MATLGHKLYDRGTAEVVLDSVSVINNGSVILRFREVEVEWSNGDQSSLQPIIDCLQRAGARPHDGRPKLFRALSLFYDRPRSAPADAPVIEHLRQDLNRQCYVLKQCDPGVRLERAPVDLHHMRVTVRRMRAVLKSARQIVATVWVEPLLSGLQWLGHILGHGRDLDVQIEYFVREMQQLKGADRRPIERFLARLQGERARYQQKLIDEMNSARYLGFLTTLQKSANDPAVVDPEYSPADLARRQFRKLKQIVNNLRASPSDKDLHRVRIRAKRVRYAAELVKACDRKRISRFVKAAKRFQELLGTHQDAVLAEQYISDVL
ncbi:hypothetical protein W02_07580 [Nitrospira sp. KM1]|uniref:CYTH and CHAD domain-containing protein n=1 Tax=Nitrospira sp. KM1 TaxID=1936990 RepID=UPI0013A73DA7|nr:CHAD domain-containing protein [Nitrospira sp. KM1]BCA53618.1 hypothetical protein W02_07580 [Nitrospira sp. KM1]